MYGTLYIKTQDFFINQKVIYFQKIYFNIFVNQNIHVSLHILAKNILIFQKNSLEGEYLNGILKIQILVIFKEVHVFTEYLKFNHVLEYDIEIQIYICMVFDF